VFVCEEKSYILCGEEPIMDYGYSCETLMDVQKGLQRIVFLKATETRRWTEKEGKETIFSLSVTDLHLVCLTQPS
jgi:hypothetical protein